MTATDGYYVARTMRALELLALEPRSAPQVADELKVDPRTARRLLQRLADAEYVTRHDGPGRAGRRYALSMRLLALAGHALQRAELPRIAAPFVTLLHEQTGHVADLFVPSYDGVLSLAHAHDGIQAVPAVRELVPCHCSAAGKALLSERPQWREAVLSGKLEALTPRTATDASALRREFAETAIRGYAIEAGEHKPDEHGVAAVVRAQTHEAIAAIAVTTTAPLDIAATATQVVRTAGSVSRLLASDTTGSTP